MILSTSSIQSADSISLIGSLGPDHGIFSVQLDDSQPSEFNARDLTPSVQALLYYTARLNGGKHTLRIMNMENAVFSIDSAVLYAVSNLTSMCVAFFFSQA